MKTNFQKIITDFSSNINSKSVFRIPYFVLTISLIATFFITYFFYSSAKTIDSVRFSNQTNKIKTEVENRLETYVALLRAGRGYMNASENVTKEEFRDFVENINLRKFYPGVLAIGYSKVIKPDEKEAFVKKMQNEVISDFSIKPDTPRNEYQAIIYIEPLEQRNQVAIGFDMSSEPTRKLALDTARDTGAFATSGKVFLVQENDKAQQAGFLIYVPVYRSKNIPESVEAKRAQIDGFIYSPFRAGEFVSDVIERGNIDEIVFEIYDNELNENNLLAVGNKNLVIPQFPLTSQNELVFGNRKWVITYTSTDKFNAQSLVWWTPIICFLGLVISVILFFLSLSQSRINQNLINTANELATSAALIGNLLESEKTARENAEKSARVKDQFLATVSHELRTPLNIISGWINILKIGGVNEETKEKALETININLRSQANLVEQMLIFSDKESIINPERFKKVSLNQVVNECLDEIKERVELKKIHLTKNLTENTSTISGDKEKLKQAINILLDNSIKFTNKNETIVVDLFDTNQKILLKITDTGEGISKEMLPHIFEGFRQYDSSSIRKHGGIGLGLAIAKKIIEAHGGTIVVESRGLNKGSTFTIELPFQT